MLPASIKTRWIGTLTVAISVLYTPWCYAQTARKFTPPSSNPENLTVMGDHVYFSAEDGRHGRELWRVDLAGNLDFIKDITPGRAGSGLGAFYAFREHLYFRYANPAGDNELWRTDGTEAGTVRVKRFTSGPGENRDFHEIVAHTDNRFFLTVGGPNTSKHIWESDGTDSGTRVLLANLAEQKPIFSFFQGTVSNSELYFGALWPNGKYAVARTVQNSNMVYVIKTLNSLPDSFLTLDSGAVLFSGITEKLGNELWITRGDAASTELVKDIYAGPESSDIGHAHLFSPENGRSIALFAATTAEYGRELWQSDGTPEGTKLWHNLLPGRASANPYNLNSTRNTLYFIAIGDGIGKEVWRFNSIQNEPRSVRDINPGLASAEPYALCLTDSGRLYFSAVDDNNDEELWSCLSSDPSETKRLMDIYPGPTSSYPDYTVSLNDRIITAATNPVYGRELWIANPGGECRLLVDIYTDDSMNPSSTPHEITPVGDLLYFAANDITHGVELWCSDGTDHGTRMVKNIFPGRASSNPSELTSVGEQLYFVAEDGIHGYELWRSDGTEPGTAMLKEINPLGSARPTGLTPYKGGLVFCAFRPLDGEELWIVEPNKEPHLLSDINQGKESSSPRDLVVWKGHVYFSANDGLSGKEFWRTDGTSEGTMMVKDIISAPVEHIGTLSYGVTPDQLFLAAEVDHRGTELWRLDNKGHGFHIVHDIAQGTSFNILRTGKTSP